METSTNAAPPVHLPRLVERWVQTAIRVQDTFGKIENAFMASPENEIRSAIWEMFSEYTRTLAAQLSDDADDARGWLEWFAWGCDFGRKPMEMVFANGETLLVVGASDLLDAIREGAVLRVRPKAMTVAVILAGLLPIMWGGGTGSEVMQRIAAPMVGGMITAPLLSMFVIPAAYYLMRRPRRQSHVHRQPIHSQGNVL